MAINLNDNSINNLRKINNINFNVINVDLYN